jgi:polyhydroxybutyrate depolymerase
MKYIVAPLIAITLAVSACEGAQHGAAKFATGVQHGSLDVAGAARTYRLLVPAAVTAGKSLPLLLALHGCGVSENGDNFAAVSHFDGKATVNGFIVAYPDGDQGCWNSGSCCGPADDVSFIRDLIDRMVKQYPIDNARVFVAGYSGGGAMAHRLACELANVITAVASVSGAFVVTTCQPARPISVLEVHGTADQTTPLTGGVLGVDSPPVPTFMSDWAQRDGCSGNPVQSSSGIAKTSQWTGCRGNTTVRLDLVSGGHHTWFGSNIDPVTGEPTSTDIVWNFFSGLATAN